MDALADPAQRQLRGLNMKKLWGKIKESWYAALPILILIGIPLAICFILWLISNWDDIPRLLDNITAVGNGSLLYGLILFVFSVIGAINAFVAFMLWFKALTEWIDRKGKSLFWFWCIIIVVTFGWYALFELIRLL